MQPRPGQRIRLRNTGRRPGRRSKCARAWTERGECLRYFFHVIDGKEMLDTVGTVLAGEAEARAEAIVVSGEMLKDLGGAFWNNGQWQVRVEDEAGNKVCALTFSADRRHLGEPLPRGP